MTPAELPAYLRAIRARVEAAAIPVVDAIAETYQGHLVNVTLTESGSHGMAMPGEGYPPSSAPGRPPMEMTRRLRGTTIRTPGTGSGGVADAVVAPTRIYAPSLEWGATHTGHPWMWLWVRRTLSPGEVAGRGWVRHEITIAERPFMRTAVAETIADGALERAGMTAFEAAVWGR